MAKRQREWALRRRLVLVDLLGGACAAASAECKGELEIDHPLGREWLASKCDPSSRVSRYFAEYRRGVPLRVLCAYHNKKLQPVGCASAADDSPF